MFRYVAFIWKAGEGSLEKLAMVRRMTERLRASSPDWQTVFAGEGVMVLTADLSNAMGVYRLQHGAGVVLGEVFVRHMDINNEVPARRAVFVERETRAMLSSKGRCLTSDYWGNYVAIVVDAAEDARYVVKDPTGSLPCYFAEHAGVQVVFSCLADCHEMGLRFHLNWEFVRRRCPVRCGGRMHRAKLLLASVEF
jgi:asparagine synthase (glutamine-hydrolysing)